MSISTQALSARQANVDLMTDWLDNETGYDLSQVVVYSHKNHIPLTEVEAENFTDGDVIDDVIFDDYEPYQILFAEVYGDFCKIASRLDYSGDEF